MMIERRIERKAESGTLRAGALLVVAAMLSVYLTACVPVIVGAVGAGAYAATDRRSLGAQGDDKLIAPRVDKRISEALMTEMAASKRVKT